MKLRVTPQLSMLLKALRAQSGVSSKDLAARIDMSPSYVSKLEGGGVRYIRKELLVRVLCVASGSDDFYGEVLPNVNSVLQGMVHDSELIDQIWFIHFDAVERQVSVPAGMGEALAKIMADAGVTQAEVLAFSNSNVDSTNSRSMPANRYIAMPYGDQNRLVMRVELDKHDLSDILETPGFTTCYYILNAVAYGVMRLAYHGEDPQSKLPPDQATEVLVRVSSFMEQWGVHSLADMSRFFSSEGFIRHQLPLVERRSDALSAVMSHLEEAVSHDSLTVSHQMLEFVRTMEWDPAFALKIASLPFSRLGDMGHTKKMQLLRDIEEIMSRYDAMSDYEKMLETY